MSIDPARIVLTALEKKEGEDLQRPGPVEEGRKEVSGARAIGHHNCRRHASKGQNTGDLVSESIKIDCGGKSMRETRVSRK